MDEWPRTLDGTPVDPATHLPIDYETASACVCGHGKYQHLMREWRPGGGRTACVYNGGHPKQPCERYRPADATLGL